MTSKSRWLTIFGYFLATAAVIMGTILLIAYGNGYSYDLKHNRLVHRGLLILQSTPSGAKITLGDKVQSQKTPYRNTFEAGWYGFTLQKDGYRTWTKRIQVIPSQVSLVQYVILLPQHLPVNEVGSYPSVSQFVASRDRRRIAFVVPAGAAAGVWSLDTGNRQQTRLYAAAQATPTQPAETVQVLSWSDDNSRLLIKSQIGDKSSILDIAGSGTEAPINLNDSFSLPVDNAEFDPGNSRLLYWNGPDGLHRLDTGNQTASPVLADHVTGYTFAAGRIIYVNTTDQGSSLWSLDSGGTKQKLADKMPASQAYELSFATYIGTPEVAVTALDSHQAILFSDIYNRPVATSLGVPATHTEFNGDGRFLLLTDANHVATYDLERGNTYTMPDINSTVTGLNWFDNYHLIFNRGGQIVLSEFDGNYAIVITRGGTLPPYATADTKAVLVTSPTSTGTSLIKSLTIRQ